MESSAKKDRDGQFPSAEFEYDYSKFDPSYEDEWNKAYQYSYFYGITTKSPIKQANME